jgi:uncharacterized RDD family membrane protein YckC
MERVGFHVRAAAFVVDLLLFAVIAHVTAAIECNLYVSGSWRLFGAITGGVAWITLMGFGFLEAIFGTSPGKQLVGCAIARGDASPASRRALLIRAMFKFAPVMLSLGGGFAYGMMMQYGVSADVRDGFTGIFWTDVVVAAGLTIFIVIGCFRAMKAERQAYHDLAAGTAVFWTRDLRASRGFVPIIARPATSDELESAASVTQ